MKSMTVGFQKLRIKDIVLLGIMIALSLVLKRLTIGNQLIQLNFLFVITAIISYWYGPWWSGVIAAVTDTIGTLVAGITFFPGFTLSAILGAVIYGVFFYNQDQIDLKRIMLAQVIIMLLVNTLLNTLWITILYKTPFMGLLPLRIVKQLVVTPIQIGILYFVLRSDYLSKIKKRLFN